MENIVNVRALRERSGNTSYSLSAETWMDIESYLYPGIRTMETGSGFSTRMFVRYGCRHIALEDWARYGARYGDAVVQCRLTGNPPWYDWKIPDDVAEDPFGLILIDGPRGKIGRDGFKRVAHQLIAPSTVVIVDDTNRSEDRDLASWIEREFHRSSRYVKGSGVRKGWTIIKKRG